MSKRMTRRDFLSISAVTAGGVVLAACSPTPPTAQSAVTPTTQPAPPTSVPATVVPPTAVAQATASSASAASSGKLRIMSRRAGSISNLDGRRWSYPDVTQHMYDGLTRYDVNGKLQGRLAESWEAVDPTTWRFKLRQGVKFHNGEDFNAEVVKYNLEAYGKLEPAWAYVSYFQGAWPLTVQVESTSSVLVKTPTPQPRVPRIITRMSIVPPVASQDKAFADNPVGTGPYRLVQWDKTRNAVLEANTAYWNGAPKIKQLEFMVGAVDAARIAALQAGEVEVIWEVPYDRVKELGDKFNVLTAPTYGLIYVGFNFKSTSPISDVRVRRALLYAIDNQGIRDSLLSGQGELLKGPIPAAVPDSVDTGGFPRRDVAMAKQLLAEAGHPDGFVLTLIIQPGEFTGDREICEAIMAQLADVGVTVKYEELDSGAFNTRRSTPNWDLLPNAVYNWVGDTPYYISVFTTNGYVSSVDDILKQSNAAEPAQRSQLVQQAMGKFWDDVPMIWGVGRVSAIAMVKNLQGAQYLPVNWLMFDKAQLVS